MATIKELIERIETRLFMLSGLDVQIHAENQIAEMLRGQYNSLFDDFWYPEYTLHGEGTLDGTTGQLTIDIDDKVRRFKDIRTVYWNEDERPLPMLHTNASYGRVRTRSVMPSPNPKKVFMIVPATETGPVHFWYRTRIDKDVWDNQIFDTEINMDDEVLMYGVVAEFLSNDDSNRTAKDDYDKKFALRQKQIRDAQWQIPLYKRKQERDGPATRWE